MKPDFNDGLVIAGLALVIYGMLLWSVPAALVAAGLVMVATGVLGAVRKGSEP